MNIITDGLSKRNKRFEYLCCLSQEALKRTLKKELKDMGREVIEGDGYLYSEGSLPILLTAHMDTVHEELPKEIVYAKGTISSPQGIGGDDRCGIYMIMKILKKLDCKVVFCEDEEIGCKGSGKFIRTEICKGLSTDNLNYVIELDRANAKDAVYYNCDNYEFEKKVNSMGFWKTAYGSLSDISVICPYIGVAGVNFSCGYYKAHRKEEYVVLSEMETALKEVIKFIEATKDGCSYEYIEDEYMSYYGRKYWAYSDYGYSKYDYGKSDYGYNWKSKSKSVAEDYVIIYEEDGKQYMEEVCAVSEEEAVGLFMMQHPKRCYNDIFDYMTKDDYLQFYGQYEGWDLY